MYRMQTKNGFWKLQCLYITINCEINTSYVTLSSGIPWNESLEFSRSRLWASLYTKNIHVTSNLNIHVTNNLRGFDVGI